jgi:hypothetical protein
VGNDDAWKQNVSVASIEFVQELLQPTDELLAHIDRLLSPLQLTLRNLRTSTHVVALHIRLGDAFLVDRAVPCARMTRTHQMETVFADAIRVYDEYGTSSGRTIIVFCDSAELKRRLVQRGAVTLDTVPRHIGVDGDVLDSFAEFHILRHVSRIYYWSPFGWRSGFVRMAHLLSGRVDTERNVITHVPLVQCTGNKM